MVAFSSAQYINMSYNRFSGTFSSVAAQKLLSLDLSSNLLNGTLPSLSSLLLLQYLNLSHNDIIGDILRNLLFLTDVWQTVGAVPDLPSSLQSFDASHNRFNDSSRMTTLSINNTCDMSYNDFECPTTWQAREECNATCHVTDWSSESVRVTVSGELYKCLQRWRHLTFVQRTLAHTCNNSLQTNWLILQTYQLVESR